MTNEIKITGQTKISNLENVNQNNTKKTEANDTASVFQSTQAEELTYSDIETLEELMQNDNFSNEALSELAQMDDEADVSQDPKSEIIDPSSNEYKANHQEEILSTLGINLTPMPTPGDDFWSMVEIDSSGNVKLNLPDEILPDQFYAALYGLDGENEYENYTEEELGEIRSNRENKEYFEALSNIGIMKYDTRTNIWTMNDIEGTKKLNCVKTGTLQTQTVNGEDMEIVIDKGNIQSLTIDGKEITDPKEIIKYVKKHMNSDSYNDEFNAVNIEKYIQENMSLWTETNELKELAHLIDDKKGGLATCTDDSLTTEEKAQAQEYIDKMASELVGASNQEKLYAVLRDFDSKKAGLDSKTALYAINQIFGGDVEKVIDAFRGNMVAIPFTKSQQEEYLNVLFGLLREANN